MFLSIETFVNGETVFSPKAARMWVGERNLFLKKDVVLRDRTRSLVSMRCKSKTTMEKIDDHQGVRTKEGNGFFLHL